MIIGGAMFMQTLDSTVIMNALPTMVLVHHIMIWRGSSVPSVDDIAPAFLIVAALTMVSLLFFIPMSKNAGTELTGRVVPAEPE